MENVQKKARIFTHEQKGRFVLWIDGPGGYLPAGARLLRGAPWDGKFEHDTLEAAQADAQSLENYIEKNWETPRSKRKARS